MKDRRVCPTRVRTTSRSSRSRGAVPFEPLEERRLLIASTYVNDNWVNDDGGDGLQTGDFVHSVAADGQVVYAEYGYNAFGTVDGASLSGAALIYDAIQDTSTGDTHLSSSSDRRSINALQKPERTLPNGV